MSLIQRARVWAAAGGVLLTGAILAGVAGSAAQAPEQVVPPAEKREPKDPTTPSPKMRDALDPPSVPGAGSPGAAPQVPKVVLKGRVLAADQPPAALLEVDGKLQIVRKDSQLNGGGRITLRVVEISRSQVVIEVQPLKETIVLQ
jgi:hypothetical protein